MDTSTHEFESRVRPVENESLPIAAVVLLLVRRIRLLLAAAFGLAVIVVVILLIQPRRYSADAAFVLQGKLGRGGLQGIAAQFGLSVPTSDAAESPLFFVDLARTRPVLGAVADSAKVVLNGNTLETLFEVPDGSAQRRRMAAIKKLDKALGTEVSTKTGIVTLTLTTPDPNASASLLALLVRTIDRINRSSQQAQAGAQRRFTEERVNAVQASLRNAEDRLQAFRAQNRVAGSPYLSLEEDRLRRDVQSAQSLYSSLQEAMEQARIEELRNTPVITLLEAPVVPIDPDPRNIARYSIVAAMFGGLLAMAYVLIAQLDTVRSLSPEQARADLRAAFRSRRRNN